jgi:hypothetical protein
VVLRDSSVLIAYHNEHYTRHPAAALKMKDFRASGRGGGVLREDIMIQDVTPVSLGLTPLSLPGAEQLGKFVEALSGWSMSGRKRQEQ